MNKKARNLDDSTIRRAMRFEEICDEFESQCFAKGRPNIETFLLWAETESKPSLLVELIAIEIHYRRQHGESIAFEDYQARFPEISYSWFDATVQKEFAKEPAAADQRSSCGNLVRQG